MLHLCPAAVRISLRIISRAEINGSDEMLSELSPSGSQSSLLPMRTSTSPPSTASPSPPASAPAADHLAALVEQLPEGSPARRGAVAALGNEVHVRMLRVNVIPSSALMAATLLPEGCIGMDDAEQVCFFLCAHALSIVPLLPLRLLPRVDAQHDLFSMRPPESLNEEDT